MIELTAHHARMLAANPRPRHPSTHDTGVAKMLVEIEDAIRRTADSGGTWVELYRQQMYVFQHQEIVDALTARGFTVTKVRAYIDDDIERGSWLLQLRVSWDEERSQPVP